MDALGRDPRIVYYAAGFARRLFPTRSNGRPAACSACERFVANSRPVKEEEAAELRVHLLVARSCCSPALRVLSFPSSTTYTNVSGWYACRTSGLAPSRCRHYLFGHTRTRCTRTRAAPAVSRTPVFPTPLQSDALDSIRLINQALC